MLPERAGKTRFWKTDPVYGINKRTLSFVEGKGLTFLVSDPQKFKFFGNVPLQYFRGVLLPLRSFFKHAVGLSSMRAGAGILASALMEDKPIAKSIKVETFPKRFHFLGRRPT